MIPDTDALDDDAFLFLDTETTGLDTGRHAMIELAYCVGLTGRLGSEVFLIDPYRDGRCPAWSLEAEAIHGVPLTSVRGAPHRWSPVTPAISVAEALRIRPLVVVGSNPMFDLGFVAAALPGGHSLPRVEVLDLRDLFAALHPEELTPEARIGLEFMMRRLTGQPNYEQPHSAAGDVADAQLVFSILRRRFLDAFVASEGHLPLVADLLDFTRSGRALRKLRRGEAV